MKLVVIIIAVVFAWMSVPMTAAAGDEGELKTALAEFIEAFMTGDAATFDRMLTKPYSHINNGGEPVERDEYVAGQYKRAKAAKEGAPSPFTAYNTSDVKVEFFNETTASVTGLGTLAGKRGDKAWSVDFRFTSVWLKNDDGQWQRAVFHDTYFK